MAEEGFSQSAASDHVWNWKFRVLKAEILLWQSQSTEVLNLLQAPPPAELSQGEFAVREKAVEGAALVNLHDYEHADARFRDGDDLASRTVPQWRCVMALYEGNEGYKRGLSAGGNQTLRDQQYNLAEQHFGESLRLAREFNQPFVEASALTGLAITATGLGHFDEGTQRSLRSLDFAKAHHFRYIEANAIANLAWSYEQLGDLAKAIANFSEGLKATDTLNQPRLKETLFNNMGETYLAEGNYVAAREANLKALAIARDLDSSKRSNEKLPIVGALTDAATSALEEGELADAEEYVRQAMDVDPNEPRVVLASARVAIARQDLSRSKAALQKLLAGRGAENLILWDAEVELAGISVAEHKNPEAEKQFQRVIDEIESARSGLQIVENRLAFSSHARRAYDRYIGFLFGTGRKDKAFQVAEYSRARTLAEGVGIPAPKSPDEIHIPRTQLFLKQRKKAILAYWLSPNESYLWVITPSRFEPLQLAPGQDIEKKVADYNQALLGLRLPEVEAQGQDLYRLLIGPAEKLVPPGTHLVIIPSGDLTKLNFETLRVPGPVPHYWIKDVELEIASSIHLLVQGRHASLAARKLLLIGDPIQASADFPALAHASEEVKRLKSHFSSAQETVVSGKDATPEAYESGHPERYSLIHFVTHGTASELSPLDSAIVLSPQGEDVFKLYARDIVNVHVRADVVTISACYGAGTRSYSGEGLVGLAWAFLRAGAHQVVAGLWEVDDRASVQLMDDFYTELQKGKPASTALRLTKLKMLDSDSTYSQPYYWASLQLYTGP